MDRGAWWVQSMGLQTVTNERRTWASLVGSSDGKASACNTGDLGYPWVEISWRRKWQPTPVLLPGESHGWRSLVGYSPWGRKESDTTERLHFHFQTFCRAPLVAQLVKNTPAMRETWIDRWEKGTATHYSIVAWRIHVQSMGSQRVRHDWETLTRRL